MTVSGCQDQLKKSLMEVSISDNIKLEIELYNESNLDIENFILWVWHADKVPPHIGISYQSKYMSLKATGKDEQIEVDGVVSLLAKKNISTLGFELSIKSSIEKIEKVYSKYSTTVPNDVTCLHPIKEVLGILEVSKLKELLSVLNDNGSIRKVIGFNIDDSFEGIVDYNIDDIHSRLTMLNFAKGK